MSIQPWDRQPFDSDETFRWFVAYRDAVPPRQLGRLFVPGTVKPTLQQLLDWYNDGAWRDRAAAWDQHLDTLRQAEREDMVGKDARAASAHDAELLGEVRALVNRELDKLNRTSSESEAEVLKPAELNKLIENVVKLGRLTRGEATEHVATDIDLSALPLEELRKLQEIKRKAGRK